MNYFFCWVRMIPLRTLVLGAWLCAAGSVLTTLSSAQSIGPRFLIGHTVAEPPNYSGPDVSPPPMYGPDVGDSPPPPPDEPDEPPPPGPGAYGPSSPPFPAPAPIELQPPPAPPFYSPPQQYGPPPQYGSYSPPPQYGSYSPPPQYGSYSPPPPHYGGYPPSPYGSSPPPYGSYSSPPAPPPDRCICPPPPYYAPPPSGGSYSPPFSPQGPEGPPAPPFYGPNVPHAPPVYGPDSPPLPPYYGSYSSPPPPYYGSYSSPPPPYYGDNSPSPTNNYPQMFNSPPLSPPPYPPTYSRRAVQEEFRSIYETETGLTMHLSGQSSVVQSAKNSLDAGSHKAHGLGRRLMELDGDVGLALSEEEDELLNGEDDDGSGLWRWHAADGQRSLAEKEGSTSLPPPPSHAPLTRRSVAAVLIRGLPGSESIPFSDPAWFFSGGIITYGTPSPYGGCICSFPPPSYSTPLVHNDFSPPPQPAPSPDLPPSLPPAKLPPPSRPSRPPPLPPRDPCDTCKACLELLSPVTVTRTAAYFMTICRDYFSSTACNQVAARILAGTSNIAARAGAMCAALGECPTALSCPNGFTVPYANGTQGYLTGQLDLCAAEGVVGGATTNLPSATPGPGSCRTKSECLTGQVCYMPYRPPQVCSCVAGKDVCYDLGTCIYFCDLSSTKYQVTRLNAGTSPCTPDASGGPGTGCGSDEVCAKMSDCQQWACSNVTQSLYTDTCTGKCRPKNLKALSAGLGSDGRSITLRLNAYASQLSRASCATVFDSATIELLAGSSAGAGTAICSAYDYWLTVSLPGTSKITNSGTDTLVFLSSGSALVAQVDPTAAFAGNVTVASCTPSCRAPSVTITGPAAIKDPCPDDGSGSSSLLQAAGTVPPSFDASTSIEPSGRAVWKNVRWSFPTNRTGLGTTAGWKLLATAVNRTNSATVPNDRLVSALTTDEALALPGADYALVVTLTSWLGTNASNTIRFTKVDSTSAPSVQVVGPAVQSFRLAKGLKASGDAGVVCAGRSISWLWTSDWFGLPEGGVESQMLYVAAPLPAAHGQSIELDLAASYVGDNKTGTDIVTMTAMGSNPVARLVGPSGFVADDADLVLNATSSIDPDTSRSLQDLTYSWSCTRDDYPSPCFPDSEQGDTTTTPGIWIIPPSLLVLKKTYTVTVTVSKVLPSTVSGLSATASITFQPRSASEPFPRGTLTRQCASSECDLSHSTEKDLTVMLVLQSAYSAATVSWSSPDSSSVASLTATTSATDSTLAAGVQMLTIPTASLPFLMSSITVSAQMTYNGVSSTTRLTVPLNSAPYCISNSDDPTACLKVQLVNDTFPSGVVWMRAQGWGDDADSSLTYEFGLRSSEGLDMPQQIGVLSSATLVGLYYGSSTVYGCAIDSEGARACGAADVTVKPPAAGFDAAAMLASINLTALEEANDQPGLLQAAAQISLLMTYMNSNGGSASGSSSKASEAAASAAASQTASLIKAILAGSNLDDPQQAQLTLASITTTVKGANGMLTDDTKTTILSTAETITTSILDSSATASVTSTVATQLLTLLAAASPSTTSISSSSKMRTPEEIASTAALNALDWLRKVMKVTAQLTSGLGRTAVPGGTNAVSTVDGLAVSAGAFAAFGSGASAFSSLTLKANSNASATTASAKWSSSSKSTTTGISGHRRRVLRGGDASADRLRASVEEVLQEAAATADSASTSSVSSGAQLPILRHRLLGSTGSTTGTSTTGEAAAVLAGDAATTASLYSLGLAHIPTASSALPVALSNALPSTVTLRGGLVSLTWAITSTDASSTVPALDGSTSYILLSIPAPGYDSDKVGNCLLYNSTSNNLSGSLAGSEELTASDKPAVFVSYNATAGRVTCRVTAAGAYVVGQSPKDVNSPPPPSPPASPAPPPSSLPPGSIIGVDSSGTGNSPPGGSSGSSSGKSSHLAAIVGGTIGAVVGVAIIAVAAFVYIRRKHSDISPASGNQLAVAPADMAPQGGAVAVTMNSSTPKSAYGEQPLRPAPVVPNASVGGAPPTARDAPTSPKSMTTAINSRTNNTSSRQRPELEKDPEVTEADPMVEDVPVMDLDNTIVQPTPSQVRPQMTSASRTGMVRIQAPPEVPGAQGSEDLLRRGGKAAEQGPDVEWVMPNTPAAAADGLVERRQSAWDDMAARDGAPKPAQSEPETLALPVLAEEQSPRPRLVGLHVGGSSLG